MNKMKIDTNLLNQEVEKINKINKQLEDIFSSIKNETEGLKDYWNSKTSEEIFISFEGLYKFLESTKTKNNEIVEFLKNVILQNQDLEDKTNSSIETNLAS